MPRLRPDDVAHAASTDHRILRDRARDEGAPQSTSIRAWHEPEAGIRQRNLALATASSELLEALPPVQRDSDPVVLAALGNEALARGDAGSAEAFFRRASLLDPADGEYALSLGLALKQKGDLAGAAVALQDAVARDASLQRAYLELSALYAKQGNRREAADALTGYLHWNPQSVLVRSTLDSLR